MNLYSFRLSVGGKDGRSRFSKSPDLAETTFTMSTIEEEQEITLSLKNLSAAVSNSTDAAHHLIDITTDE